MRLAWIVASSLVAAACGDNHAGAPDGHLRVDATHADAPIDSTPDAPPDAPPQPDTLAGTGLCLDDACASISPTALEYAPQFVLYADLASKRRWIQLPAGTKIDTSDMDHWVFPVGTKVWKEFTDEHDVRIETRFATKVLADDTAHNSWFYVSYAWNATQDAATAAPNGVVNANGTTHDIPTQAQCQNCHNKLANTHVLGFGAISLDFHQTTSGLLDLDGAATAEMLSVNPTGAQSPHFPLPGTADEQAALGYLHANCGHCHNSESSLIASGQALEQLRLETIHLDTVDDTLTYQTTVDASGGIFFPSGADCPGNNCTAIPNCPPDPATGFLGSGDNAHSCVVVPGDPTDSMLFFRFTSLDFGNAHMPQTCVKTTDPVGTAVLQTWINGLPH